MKTRFTVFAVVALAFAGCTKDNSGVLNNEGPVAARFTADITPATRVNSEGTGFTDGDCIGITGAGYTNIPYVTGGDGNFTPKSTTIYYNDAQNYTFSAYCPYKDDSELTDDRITATTDAGAQKAQAGMDFLFASGATGSTSSPTVKFTFRHCMSRVTLTFGAGSGVDFSGARPESYTLGGLQLDGTFDTVTGIAAADAGAQSGQVQMALESGALTSSVILFPQTADALPLVVEYNGQEYKATLTVPDGALQAGNNYTWTVKVNNKGLDVGSATITAWDEGNDESGAADPEYTVSADGKTYYVYTANGLLAWNEAVQSDLSLNCTLAADINMTGIDWTPVGYYDNKNWQYIMYTGTFDGGGHTITGLTVDLPDQEYVGLIGCLGSGGTVQNMTLAEVEINGGNLVGGVAGANYFGTVTACTVSGDVSGTGWVGGVAGGNDGTVTGCTVSGDVSGTTKYVGGVAGLTSGTVTGCYATGDVTGNERVGGVVGHNLEIGTVTGCYATGDVSGNNYVGGVAGANYFGTVTACYWSVYDDNGLNAGIGGGNFGSGDATKVDGTTVTWVDAQSGMNEAIDAWNENNPNKQCNWRYAETDAETPPTLEPND